ncbi:hypothetical protein MNBD_GAMMA22-2678 [hydrothermal vent metagenome]|uniref:RND transporter n=1 Tax=hydrothermal vent metagenome TaxID=652676 RepID=A0A3B1ABS1_9ZZZZ
MKILDKIPYPLVIIIAIFLAIAPPTGEPHLIEKLKMLGNLNLSKFIDMFDLFLHSSPLIVLLLKIIRTVMTKNNSK